MLLKITLTLCRGTSKDTCILRSPTYAFRNIYHPQRSWGKVMFLQASVILLTGGGACVVAGGGGGHAWLPGGCVWSLGVCMVVGGMRGCRGVGGMCGCQGHAWLPGGVHGCGGACMVAGGCAWLLGEGVCMVARGVHGYQGDMCGCGGHAWLWGGHAWLLGGMRGSQGACVVAGGGVHRIR